ncbi:sodium-dependent transporter [Elysia marginata]|uniref:Sodium-dependent transporter n=1 Tax=Elysia marginata TaxID=1093978 RepID=A0AAV4F2L8_9GAST|nr:sodium-dependent transporter [Elysia marginata]
MSSSDSTDRSRTEELRVTEQHQLPRSAVTTDKVFLSFAKSFSLATAYSANVGGMATLTGTPPNVLFKGLADG